MPRLNLCDKFTDDAQVTWKSLPKLIQQNLGKYEQHRSVFMANNFHNGWATTPEMSQVTDEIFVGNVFDATNPGLLRSRGISTILNMAVDEDYADYDDVEDIDVLWLGIKDGHLSSPGVFEHAAQLIADEIAAGRKIIVHCSAGISRSVTAVITYLMLNENLSFHAALAKVNAARSIASPHPLLVRALIRDLGKRFTW